MITIRKLADLPPKTRLRKISRILRQLEYRLRGVSTPGPADGETLPPLDYVLTLFAMVAAEPKVPEALKQRCARYVALPDLETAPMVRAMNDVHHALEQLLGHTAADWDFFTDGELDGRTRRTADLYLYLDDLRSPFNVGAVFRAADAFGVRGVFLSPGTASPDHPRAARSSMGAVSVIPWWRLEVAAAVEHVRTLIARPEPGALLPQDPPSPGFFVVETGGTPLSDFRFPETGIAVIGSEELGVGPEALSLADGSAGRVTIPMAGAKGSLNVAVAAGIVLYHWWRAVDPTGPLSRG